MIGITEHGRGHQNRWPWPSPRPGYYTRVWQPGIIIKCESANKLSSRPGRKCKIIDLTGAGAHINYVRSEVHNNKRGTLWTLDWVFRETSDPYISREGSMWVERPERFFMQSVSHFSLWLEMQQDPNCTCHTLRGNLLGALKDVWRTGSIWGNVLTCQGPGLWIETLQCAR